MWLGWKELVLDRLRFNVVVVFNLNKNYRVIGNLRTSIAEMAKNIYIK